MHSTFQYYKYFTNLSKLLILGVIPLALLLYYNGSMIRNTKSPSFLVAHDDVLKLKSRKREIHSASVLFGIVATFIICHTMRIFILFHEMVIISYTQGNKFEFVLWQQLVIEINELMLVLNSSVNTIIYCCLNKKFRNFVTTCQYKK